MEECTMEKSETSFTVEEFVPVLICELEVAGLRPQHHPSRHEEGDPFRYHVVEPLLPIGRVQVHVHRRRNISDEIHFIDIDNVETSPWYVNKRMDEVWCMGLTKDELARKVHQNLLEIIRVGLCRAVLKDVATDKNREKMFELFKYLQGTRFLGDRCTEALQMVNEIALTRMHGEGVFTDKEKRSRAC